MNNSIPSFQDTPPYYFESDKLDKFLPDWLKFQKEMDTAKKSSFNSHFKSKFANLEEVMSAVKPALFENGFCFIQFPSFHNGLVFVATKIYHVASNQWIACVMGFRPQKDGPQEAGSCITYGKRYTLEALTGLESEDDDGNKASIKDNNRAHADAATSRLVTSTQPTPPQNKPQTTQAPEFADYVIQVGKKWKGRSLASMDLNDLKGYVQYFYDTSKKQGKPIDDAARDFLSHAEAYIASFQKPVPVTANADSVPEYMQDIPF